MILDGWGMSPDPKISAIEQANTPFVDSLYQNYPHATLKTYGMHVGLPDGQMGNSEVGHMNLGAGRIVYQDFAKINKSVAEGSFAQNEVLQSALDYANKERVNVHLLGLCSDGGVHAHTSHLRALIDFFETSNEHSNTFIHAFSDGRDVDPKSGAGYIKKLEEYIANKKAVLASVTGRYYAMDRDQRWERVKIAYDAIVKAEGNQAKDIVSEIEASYENGVTDEFIMPIIKVNDQGSAVGSIKEKDVVLFFNFRTDRGRELSQALSQSAFPEQEMHPLSLHFVTMTRYDDNFKNVSIVFDKDNLNETLGEVVSKAKKKQLRIAETEKYPHVTFFFNGGKEAPFEGEERILCPSPKVATYDLQPEMSAFEIRDALKPHLVKGTFDFICLNFANPDMVGHTGDMNAAIKACEAVDSCAETLINEALNQDYTTLVIADHGNCDTMINEDGSPNTAHTTNPVPLILVDKDLKEVKDGVLGDIAPTILKLMGIDQPASMTQKPLV
jgi:2,3-bisphosphoglycerate-independent phosphoglycerate mutase